MYLHIGGDKLLRSREIIGIFDLDTASVSVDTRNFLKARQKQNSLFSAVAELPKSFIVTEGGQVYFSQFSSAALKNRVDEY